METDSAVDQVGASLEFDFNFDEDNLMGNPNTQMPSDHPQSETAENISTQEYVELGSSSAGSNHEPLIHQTNSKQNLTPSTLTSSDLSDPPLEHAPNLAQPAAAFNPPLIQTPQSCHPTTDNAECESPGGHCQPQLNLGNPNWNYPQQAFNTSENAAPPVVNTPSLPQLGPSSSNTTLIGTPQPYPPTMVGLIAHDGAVQSFQAEHEASTIYPNHLMNARSENVPPMEHMPLPHNMGPLNEFTTNNQTLQNSTSNNFSSIRQQPSLCPTLFPQNTIGVGVINQRPLPINQQYRATLLPHNQLNAPYRPLTPLGSQSNEFMTANVFDPQCINFMLPQAFALLRPQQSSNQLQQLNQVSQMPNVLFDPQCQYSMLPGFHMPLSYSPRSFLYHQVPVTPNVYDSQGYNSNMLPPELSISARPPQLANYQQQLNQVWTTQNSLLPGSSMNSRLQELYGRQQLNQLAQLMPNLHPQLASSLLPEMLSGSPQLLDHYEHSNQVLMPPYACNPQHNSTAAGPSALPRPQRLYDHKHSLEQVQDSQFCGSMLHQPSMLFRPQQSSKHQQLYQIPETANRLDSQHDNILSPQSSRPSSSQTAQTKGLLNQAARQSVSYLSPGTNTQQAQILNSQTQREIGVRTKVAVPDLCETSMSSFKERGLVEGHRRAAKRHVLGEPSLSSKRSTSVTIRQERSLLPSSSQEEDRTSQSEGNEVEISNLSNPSNTRLVKNAVYDPTFEGFGLPVDPHLRLFGSS